MRYRFQFTNSPAAIGLPWFHAPNDFKALSHTVRAMRHDCCANVAQVQVTVKSDTGSSFTVTRHNLPDTYSIVADALPRLKQALLISQG